MRKADNLPPSCAVVTKSGNLNFLEPSGPVQACNGTALPSLSSQVLRSTCLAYGRAVSYRSSALFQTSVDSHIRLCYVECGVQLYVWAGVQDSRVKKIYFIYVNILST